MVAFPLAAQPLASAALVSLSPSPYTIPGEERRWTGRTMAGYQQFGRGHFDPYPRGTKNEEHSEVLIVMFNLLTRRPGHQCVRTYVASRVEVPVDQKIYQCIIEASNDTSSTICSLSYTLQS
ncbi:hypothetical protein AB1N83_006131 [Pleurotus pulmonarius]